MPGAEEHRRSARGQRLRGAAAAHASGGPRPGSATGAAPLGADAPPDQPQQQPLAGLVALAAQGGPSGGWATLPHTALAQVFDQLALADLAAAASVCSTWRYEASLDARWKAFWQQQVSDVGLWRWAKAEGGYRKQLRAKQLVRRGECSATVFPFSRQDGAVSEVLFFDGGPRDADKRILTVQIPKVPGTSVRLSGSTLKLWDAAALLAQRPLLVVHDVLKHMQLENGQLLLWRIADDATVLTVPSDPDDPADEAWRWAEHPALEPSVLEPGSLVLRDVPLEAAYGRGVTPCEWLDMSGGLVAGSLMVPSQGRLLMRLFDLATGRCLRASSCALPIDDGGLQLGDHEVTMVVTRSGEAGSLVVATCALFDTRVFIWRLRDSWVAAGQAAAAAAPPCGASSSSSSETAEAEAARLAAARAACWDPAATQAYGAAAIAASPGAAAPIAAAAAVSGSDDDAAASGPGPGSAAAGGGQYELRHAFTTPDQEPVVDISISTTAHRLFIIGMESIFIADLSGMPYMRVSTLSWRGVVPPGEAQGPADVGAFSWPLPNSSRAAFFLDATNSLFIAEFRRPQMADFWYMAHTEQGPPGRHPRFDHHYASTLGPGGAVVGQQPYYVQSHTDLRPTPRTQLLSTLNGRAAGLKALEPGIVEYSQDGGVIFTTADSSCPAVASLLQLEKAAGAYLPGLGPASVSSGGASGRRRPYASSGGKGQTGKLAPRALVLIDSSSGCRYKAVPLDGIVESVHSAGQYLVLSIAELGSYPEGLRGSIVVLDFSGNQAGFGLEEEPAAKPVAARAKRPAAGARSRGGTAAGKQQQQKQKQKQGKAAAKPRGGSSSKGGAKGTSTTAAAEEDLGRPAKRSRR